MISPTHLIFRFDEFMARKSRLIEHVHIPSPLHVSKPIKELSPLNYVVQALSRFLDMSNAK